MSEVAPLETVPEITSLKSMSTTQVDKLRLLIDYDPWIFGCKICQHEEGWVERFHRPLMYWLTGHTELLVRSLELYQSEVVNQIKAEFRRLGLLKNGQYDRKRITRYLQRIDTRIARSMSKTITELDGILWLTSRTPDALSKGPNESVGIGSKSPENVIKFFDQLNLVLRSDPYRLLYPDRIPPKNVDQYWTQLSITLWGRDLVATEATIEGRGLGGGWTSSHYSLIVGDDLVGTESGDANIEQALTWLAALRGISRTKYIGGTRYLFTGTIYGPNDDHAFVTQDWHTPSIMVPIWLKDNFSVENIMEDGVPVLPEWYDVDDIRQIRSEIVKEDNGIISFLQNFELTAHEIGSTMFTKAMCERQRMVRLKDGSLAHPKKGVPNDGVYNPDTWIKVDPKTLPIYMGIDQSVSLKDGADSWAVAIVAVHQDWYYVLETRTGKGYKTMLFWSEKMFKQWMPVKIGLDTAGQQAITLNWMQESDLFKAMAGIIEPLQSSNRAKEDRIRAFFSSRLEAGTIWLAPSQLGLESEMVKYRPGPKAQDDQLDAISLAVAVAIPGSMSYHEIESYERQSALGHKKHLDEFGVHLDSWLTMV